MDVMCSIHTNTGIYTIQKSGIYTYPHWHLYNPKTVAFIQSKNSGIYTIQKQWYLYNKAILDSMSTTFFLLKGLQHLYYTYKMCLLKEFLLYILLLGILLTRIVCVIF